MANLLAAQRATLNGDFVSRVQAAVLISAVAVKAADTPALPQQRGYIAYSILRSPEGAGGYLTQFIWLVAANPVISNSVTSAGAVDASDEEIETAVVAVWDLLYPLSATPAADAGY